MPRRALTGCVHAEEGVGLLPGRAGADAPGVVLPSVDLRDQDFPARVRNRYTLAAWVPRRPIAIDHQARFSACRDRTVRRDVISSVGALKVGVVMGGSERHGRGRIVVGVTDAPAGWRAVNWAATWAVGRSDQVELVSIIGAAMGVPGEAEVIGEAVTLTQRLLEREANRVRERGVSVGSRVGRGDVVELLIEASKGAALLVLGSDYRGTDFGPARGPHGIRIVAGAHCPVVVVPDLDVTGRSGVVVGVDGSEVSEAAIAFAAAEADRSGQPLTAVSAWSPITVPRGLRAYPDDYLGIMQKMAAEALAVSVAWIPSKYPNLELRCIVERGDPEPVIRRLATQARLAVVGSHRRGPVARFLLGSTSQQVLARLATPTVVV